MTDTDAPAAGIPEPNTLLRDRMRARGYSAMKLAAAANVNERTIARWLEGGVRPQAGTAGLVAAALECEPHEIFPRHFASPRLPGAGVVPAEVYASRAHVPVDEWVHLFEDAAEHIDVCVYGGTFLFDTVPDFVPMAQAAARRGAAIRFIAGDPQSAAVYHRGVEERIEHSLAERCRMTLRRLEPLAGEPNVTVRVHGTPLYASIFRADGTMIVNPHLYGSPASDNPALLISEGTAAALWGKYARSFERIWATARPAHHHDGGN